ncbi:MAG: PEP-CTERM sorting domain-containing protein [Gemmatales bacterium]
MLRRMFIASVLAITCFSAAFAQNTTVTYFMNGDAGADVGRSATVAGPLALVASNFANTPSGTAISPGTDINVGGGSPNEALSFTGSPAPSSSFTFSVTVPAGPAGWEISNYGFDVRTQVGVTGTATLFLDSGSGFVAVATTNLSAAVNDTWRGIADTTSSTIIFPGNTVNARLDFTSFTGEYDVDSIFLRGASNFSTVPEPASVALLGITGVGCAAGVWYRRRKLAKLSNVKI